MCGIFGHFSSTPLRRKHYDDLVSAGVSQNERGDHAFGFAWAKEDGDVESYKQPGSIKDNYQLLSFGLSSVAMIGHTRWATHGSVEDNSNNHPHWFNLDGEDAYLVHNGIIGNYRQICWENNLKMVTECDSEVIARHIEAGEGSVLKRVQAAINSVDPCAPFAAAILTKDALVIARRGNPMYWSEDGNTRWFASTAKGLKGKVWMVPNNKAFVIPIKGNDVQSCDLNKREATTTRYIGSDLFE